MKLLLISLFILTLNLSLSQNLISNGGFETFSACPTTFGEIHRASGWHNANAPVGTLYPSSDYFNTCSYSTGGINPPSGPYAGNGYAGFNATSGSSGGAEMIGTNVSLTSGVTYTISFYIHCQAGTNGSPVYIMGVPTAGFPIPTTPQYCPTTTTNLVTMPASDLTASSWTFRSYTFTPSSNFQSIVFGGICNNSYTQGFIFIDDVSLTTACPSAPSGSGGNTSICQGSAFTFPSRSCSAGSLRWYENSAGTGTFHTSASVSPSSTTTYYPFCYTTCLSSSAGAPVTVTVNSPSTANNTTSNAAICENQTKTLTATPSGGNWTVLSGGGNITGTTYTPANISTNTSVTIRYTIPASGGCPASTDNVTFTVNNLPTSNTSGNAGAICEGGTKTLTATPTGGTWVILSGGGAISGNTYTAPSVTSNTNVTVQYTLTNGTCSSNNTVGFIVNDNGGVANNTTSTNPICEYETKTLTATPSGGTWNIVSGTGFITGNIYSSANITNTETVVISYNITGAGACSASSDNVSFLVNPAPTIVVTEDTSICLGEQINLDVTGGVTYNWSTGSTTNSTTVNPTTQTRYYVTATVNNCSTTDSVDVSILTGTGVDAVSDFVTAVSGQNTQIDITVNDIGSVNSIQIITPPDNGNASISSGGFIDYTSVTNFNGEDTLTYSICDDQCNNICDTAQVFITVEKDIEITEFISPNGDGKNEAFVILGLERYPNNELKIFNRWGKLIFEASPYNNDWKANQNNASTNLKLTSGTYFYILNLNNESEPITGYIQVRR